MATRRAVGRLAGILGGLAAAGCAGPAAAPPEAVPFVAGQVVEVVTPAVAAVPAGQCAMADQTAWVSAEAPVLLQSERSLGPNKETMACELAWRDVERQGVRTCAARYDAAGFYRNGRLAPLRHSWLDCACQEGSQRTVCVVSVTATCRYEVLRVQPAEVCG
ncbi:MAG: hypothetical protein R3F55_02915 [Alphaproteobacteria bacterium]